MNAYNQKYEITDIAHEEYSFLHRIRALRDVGGTVRAGDLGGFVENEGNLSFAPESEAWIADDAIAFHAACVEDAALLRDQAVICGEARVRGMAVVADHARVEDHAVVNSARVEMCAVVSAHAMISVDTNGRFPTVDGKSIVHGIVVGNVLVTGSAVVLGDEKVVNEAMDRLVLTENGRIMERNPARDQFLPSAQYFGQKRHTQKRTEPER